MLVRVGTHVYYQGKQGVIVWVYDNGQCEFKETMTDRVILVHIEELTVGNEKEN